MDASKSLKTPKPKKFNGLLFLEVGLAEVFSVIFVLLLFFGILNYFEILPISESFPFLSFLPQSQRISQQTNFSPAPTASSLIFSCPVPKEYCISAKEIVYNNNPALAYNLPQETQAKTIVPVVDSIPFVLQPYKKGNPIGFYQSHIYNNYCYTVTYTFPFDTKVRKITSVPLEKGSIIATVSSSFITLGEEKQNLILQIQKRPINPNTKAKPDFQRCPVINLNSKDFGEYLHIKKDMLQ